MSVLVDWQIRKEIESGRIKIDPFKIENLNPSSLDVTLGSEFAFVHAVSCDLIDLTSKHQLPVQETHYLEDFQSIDLPPNGFILGVMAETISLPDDISVKLFGKSSWARAGLDNSSAGAWIECGFPGSIVLEIKNLHPSLTHRLHPGMLCGQLIFYKHAPAEVPYNLKKKSKYIDQVGIVGSKGV